jgi:hypothetical protein
MPAHAPVFSLKRHAAHSGLPDGLPDQDLYHDATRDLCALGCHIGIINNCQTLDRETRVSGLAKDCQEGVLFMCARPLSLCMLLFMTPAQPQRLSWLHRQSCLAQPGHPESFSKAHNCMMCVLSPCMHAARSCRTYMTLIGQGKGRTRLQQVMDWCGGPDFDGPLIFDEVLPPLCSPTHTKDPV